MPLPRALLAAAALVPLAISSSAQVPPGHALWTLNNPLASGHGAWEYIDPATGGLTLLSGITVAGEPDLFARRMDPTDGTIIATKGTDVFRVKLAGSAAIQKTFIGSSFPLVAVGVDFDRDGNVLFTAGNTIWRIDVQTGLWAPWSQNPFGHNFTSLAIDDTTNDAWALSKQTGFAFPTNLAKANGTGAVPVWSILASVASNHGDGVDTDEAGSVYFADELTSLGPVHYFKEHVAFAQISFALESTEAAEWLHVDRRDGRLHVVTRGISSGGGNSGGYYVHDPAGSGTVELIDFSPSGNPVTILVNDWIDRTSAFPKKIATSSNVSLRVATHGNAGEWAGLGITAINGAPIAPILLGSIGLTDAGGFRALTLALPAGTLSAGITATLQGARLDAATSQIVLAAPVDIVTVP